MSSNGNEVHAHDDNVTIADEFSRSSPEDHWNLKNQEQDQLIRNEIAGHQQQQQQQHWERRYSFLGLPINTTHGSLKSTKENDKILTYINKTSKLERYSNSLNDSRPTILIGKIDNIFNWESALIDDSILKSIKDKKTRNFYQEQNELIEKYMEVDKILDSGIHHKMIRNYSDRNDPIDYSYGSIDHSNSNDAYINKSPKVSIPSPNRRDSAVPGDVDLESGLLLGYNKSEELKLISFAINVNFLANICLLLGKIIVAILTMSISIIASLVDSILDLLSTLIIFFANKLANTKNPKHFPIGRSRLEPIGVLVFSIIIILSFCQVGIESLQRLINHSSNDEIISIGITPITIMTITILVKLICYFWCIKFKSSSVQALAQDALVDVVFNFFSIVMPIIGYYTQIYWFDPMGALLLSIYIVFEWSKTCFEHINHLTGKSADSNDVKIILYLCSRFSNKIINIKNLNCYHVGDSLNVEVDLILDEDLNMRDSHDLAESLQYTIESLPSIDVERAFVHLDYNINNFKGHLS
ncbi:putative membrane protein [Wickerhamomyces ciferrii]|uniref:Membrane protein n=1 Tax=Wickerhamomyces ciferrii (strain ATCC 14091 / BCRC 22168 / CBS 111 / JCM 3599 / NBRC 0793 / NRRL Y-1031 F-60-10) TaxID=1206466 RepID=K0KG27_WICCF|nr:uncharacterized protein BN7_1430 [Wickerhamomyces ciferrii]CCH41891.1 putative membrane protein [Wickerhamomyces ciferrii]